VYGEDGTAFWLTRMVPGVERADVRGRQVAWLLVVGPAMVVLTVAPIAVTGQGWAWPFVLASLAAVLGATPGLMAWVSVARPVPEKDPHLRAGPFDTGDDPSTSGALAAHGYLMLLLVAACAVPGASWCCWAPSGNGRPSRSPGSWSGSRPAGCCAGGAAGPPPAGWPTAAPS
jgi:ABC-2 type transport system permease protein